MYIGNCDPWIARVKVFRYIVVSLAGHMHLPYHGGHSLSGSWKASADITNAGQRIAQYQNAQQSIAPRCLVSLAAPKPHRGTGVCRVSPSHSGTTFSLGVGSLAIYSFSPQGKPRSHSWRNKERKCHRDPCVCPQRNTGSPRTAPAPVTPTKSRGQRQWLHSLRTPPYNSSQVPSMIAK